MMYQSKIVAVIKVGGKVLRESDGMVSLPFGCEYSILVKNLDSVRAQFTVSVDGTEATEGTRLILAPNSHVELERFIRGGNLAEGNRFKFIERTGAIEAHRGIGVDDGLVRVEAWKELVRVPPPVYPRYVEPTLGQGRPSWPRPGDPRPQYPVGRPSASPQSRLHRGSPIRTRGFSGNETFAAMGSTERERGGETVTMGMEGITVPGSRSEQRFTEAAGFPVEFASTVIVLRLRGVVDGAPIAEAVTVSHNRTSRHARILPPLRHFPYAHLTGCVIVFTEEAWANS